MLRQVVTQVARGFCMGAADLVPGVSGGTIAFVFGIYQQLIGAIGQGARALARLIRLDVRGALVTLGTVDWGFLIPLLVGIVLAVLSLAHLMERLLEEQPVRMAGLFFGLVIGSLFLTAKFVQRNLRHLATFAAVAAVAFILLGLRSGSVNEPALWFLFVAGAVASCAMILPGISGSFLLLMLGMYDFVLSALNDRELAVLAVFIAGMIAGLSGFSSILHAALRSHADTVLAALVGLIAGSLRVLWPWPDGTQTTTLAAPANDVAIPILLVAVGALAVVALTHVASRTGGMQKSFAGIAADPDRAGRNETSPG